MEANPCLFITFFVIPQRTAEKSGLFKNWFLAEGLPIPPFPIATWPLGMYANTMNSLTKSIPLALGLTALTLSACGGETPPSVADFGWTFNYRDWTKPNCAESDSVACTDDDFRGCDNAPEFNTGPAYPAVDKVRVHIFDPLGQIQPLDREYECNAGVGGTKVPIRGLPLRSYTVELEAKAADGTVLYRYLQEDVDLTSKPSEVLELGAATGELNFTPGFAGNDSGVCPDDADTVRYTVTNDEDEVLLEGSSDACEGVFTNDLYIREIPTEPSPGVGGSFLVNTYNLRLEGLSGETVNYCVDVTRSVAPGNNNARNNETLSAGACP